MSSGVQDPVAGNRHDTYRVRASAVKDFLDCAMRAEAKHIQGLRMPSSPVAKIGTAFHGASALLDSTRLADSERDPAEAGEAMELYEQKLDEETEESEKAKWDDDVTRNDATLIGAGLIPRYMDSIMPAHNFVAVEAKLTDYSISWPHLNVTIKLTGTTDRIQQSPTREGIVYGICDIKSGKTRVNKEGVAVAKADKPQLAVYELIAEKASSYPITMPARIIGCGTAKTARVGVVDVPGTRIALVGTDETPGVLDFLAKMLKTGLFPPNPSSMMCGEKYCPIYNRCPYHD